MKITIKELLDIVEQETDKAIRENKMDEGALDFLKGAGKSVGGKAASVGKSAIGAGKSAVQSVSDKEKSVGNKVGQVASDAKNAGASASLQGDITKAVQESGMMIQKFTQQFQDLLARAQALHMNDLEQEVKSELQALETYMQTAGKTSGSSVAPASVDSPKLAPKTNPASVDLPAMKSKPAPIDLPAMKTNPASVDLPPLPSKKTNDAPLDWTSGSKKPKKPPAKQSNKKAGITKDMIKKAYSDSGNNPRATAKKLGLTLDQIRNIMKPETTKQSADSIMAE